MFDKLKKKLGLDISQENLRIRAEQLNKLIALLPTMLGALGRMFTPRAQAI